MKISDNLQTAIEQLGFHDDGKFGVKIISFVMILLSSFLNGCLYLIYKWESVNDRINSMRALVFQIIVLSYTINYMCSWKNFENALKMIDMEVSSSLNRILINPEYTEFRNKINLEKLTLFNRISMAAKIYMITLNFGPLCFGLIKLLTDNNPINIETLPLPYPFYYPEYLRNYVTAYFLVYSVQTVLNYFALNFGYVSFCLSFICMEIVESDFQSLRLTLKEFRGGLHEGQPDSDERQLKAVSDMSYTLHDFLKIVVQCHQNIYRKSRIATKATQSVALNCNYGISVLLCITLYFIVETNKTVVKLTEGLTILPISYVMYMYGLYGQKIINENEKFMLALYDLPWIDKPNWFQRSISTIMTRNKKNIEIRPFGLQVLNLKHFATVMNAAYSYYSVIHSTRFK